LINVTKVPLLHNSNTIKKRKIVGILNTPIGAVLLETHGGIAGITTQGTAVSDYRYKALLSARDLTRHFLCHRCPLLSL
jgi:hypothetical protein